MLQPYVGLGEGRTFLLLCAGGEDDDVALSCLFVCASAHACTGVAVEGCIGQVLDLGVADFFFGIDQEDFAGDRVHDKGVGNCCADIAGANDGDGGGELGVWHVCCE